MFETARLRFEPLDLHHLAASTVLAGDGDDALGLPVGVCRDLCRARQVSMHGRLRGEGGIAAYATEAATEVLNIGFGRHDLKGWSPPPIRPMPRPPACYARSA